MTRLVAFLRAINVGGHTVKMESLRRLFEALGFSEVETFISSGNVLFGTTEQNPAVLEANISAGLQKALGYEVAAFVRSMEELARIAAYQPFPQSILEAAATNNVIFLSGSLDDAAQQKLMALTSEIDYFATHASEVYWCCRRLQSQSTFSNAVLEKTLGVKSTIRGVNTIQKLAARVASLDSEG
jgi:uncharacterized protein (DUF1697 family)